MIAAQELALPGTKLRKSVVLVIVVATINVLLEIPRQGRKGEETLR